MSSEEEEARRREIFDRRERLQPCRMHILIFTNFSCQELLAEMVHTKDGSRSVREFIAQGSAKVGGRSRTSQ
jgi:hypothetical protein